MCRVKYPIPDHGAGSHSFVTNKLPVWNLDAKNLYDGLKFREKEYCNIAEEDWEKITLQFFFLKIHS